MALIRNANAPHATAGAVVLDLGDLKRQSDAIKEAATAQARRIVDDASQRGERILADAAEEGRRRGYEEGLAEGRADGLAEGRTQAHEDHAQTLEDITNAWSEALNRFVARRESLFVESRSDVLRMALCIARKVVKRTIEADSTIVQEQLQSVLSLVSRRTRLVIAIHPDDEPLLREALPRLAGQVTASEHIELVTDDTLARGSCVARTDTDATIDASIDAQLDRLASAILGEVQP